MPNPSAAVTMYTCPDCGEQVFGFGAFGNHRKRHIAERRAAGGGTPPVARVRERRPRRTIESLRSASPESGVEAGRPLSPPPDSAAADSGTEPTAGPVAGPPPDSRPARPSIAAPAIRVGADERQRSIDEAIRDAMPLATLADIVRSLSVAVSEADGAGPAGYLSEIQSAQVAALLYDSTIDTVVHRFGGDVNRFKAGLAVLIILIAKGGVHARAIGTKVQAARQERMRSNLAAAEPANDEANGNDPIAAAMALQRSQPAVRLD